MREEWQSIAADMVERKILTASMSGVLTTFVIAMWTVRECRRRLPSTGSSPRRPTAISSRTPPAAPIRGAGASLPTIRRAWPHTGRHDRNRASPDRSPPMTKARRPTWIFDESDIPDPFGNGERAVEAPNPASSSQERERALRTAQVLGTDCSPHLWAVVPRWSPASADRVCASPSWRPQDHARRRTRAAPHHGRRARPNGQAMVAASAEEDASICYSEAAEIVKATPWLDGRMKLNESTLA